jgi:hypothetical protein
LNDTMTMDNIGLTRERIGTHPGPDYSIAVPAAAAGPEAEHI